MTLLSPRTRLVGFLVIALLLIAVGIRYAVDSRRPIPPPALDDSQVTVSLSPPPLPPDGREQMREVNTQLNQGFVSDPIADLLAAAKMAQGIGDIWRAEDLTQAALRRSPEDPQARLLLANLLSQQERLSEAQILYLQLHHQHPGDVEPYLQLESIALREGKRAEAWKWLARGVTEGAQTADSLVALAHRYYYLDDFPAAQDALTKAAQVAPADVNVKLQRSIFFYERGRLAESRSILEAILHDEPENEPAHRLLAEVLIHPAYPAQDPVRANALLEQAVAIDPKDPEIYRLAAATYRHLHLFRMAAEAYTALLTLEPRSADARYGLGQIYVLLGKKDFARTQFDLCHLLQGREQQIASLSSTVSQHPLDAKAHAALAQGLETNKDFAGALREWQVAVGLAPGEPGLKMNLAQLYARLGWNKHMRRTH